MNKIIWISSYPKSGNTWLRYLISNYFFNKNRVFDQKIIKYIKKFPQEDLIEKIANKNDLIKNKYNISNYWKKASELIDIKSGNVAFVKNHNFLIEINKNTVANIKNSLAFIYIVRDPRDVVISYAKYKGISIDQSIDQVCSKDLNYIYKLNKNNFPNIEILGSWKTNYISWRDNLPEIPRFILKYEDLISDSYKNFYNLILFLSNILNFKIDDNQLLFSLEASAFKNLQQKERDIGFFENYGKSSFFRNGKSGIWKLELNSNQVKYIEKKFFNEMKSLNYI